MFRTLLCPSSWARDYNAGYHTGCPVRFCLNAWGGVTDCRGVRHPVGPYSSVIATMHGWFLFLSYHDDARLVLIPQLSRRCTVGSYSSVITTMHSPNTHQISSKIIAQIPTFGVRKWPWQCFALGKADLPLFVANNRCAAAKDALGWSAVVFCACEIMQLFSVGFCVVRAVHRIEFRLLINENVTTLFSAKDSCSWRGL